MKEQIEKQAIEEIFDIITTDCDGKCVGCEFEDNEWCFTHHAAKAIYNAGYSKQSEGEWIWKSNGYMKYLHCSCCGKQEDWETSYCPNCGAKMKGGAE